MSKSLLDYARSERQAVGVIMRYGMIDGGHHKQWVLDQALRALLGDGYEDFMAVAKLDDPDFEWDTGVTP